MKFKVKHSEELPTDDVTHCIACLNVDEDSELRNGDKGFAACYKTYTGDYWNFGLKRYIPEWVFLGEIEATNKGNNIKATGDNGWEETFTWNKYNDGCSYFADEKFLLDTYHSSIKKEDKIRLISKKRFTNTGLNTGENHLKCFFTTGGMQATSKTASKDWSPKMTSAEGESLSKWVHSGIA